MAETSNQKLGIRGEQAAEAYLIQQGYKVHLRNYRFGRSELDIVCQKDSTLCIVEVKSHSGQPLTAAEYRISKPKQKMIIRGANGLLSEFPEYEGLAVRFDVIIVDFSNYPLQITHHEAAFWDESGWGEFL